MIALSLVVLCASAPVPQGPETSIVQVPAGLRVTDQMVRDVDGDDATDLVLACRDTKTGQRSLRVHLRQATGPAFLSQPSRPPYLVDRDVVAFAFCECLPAAGPELILLLPEQVVAVVAKVDGTPDYLRLLRHDLLWPAASADGVLPPPNATVDFDRDGRDDLLLPGPDSWSVLLQDRQADAPLFERRLDRTLPKRTSAIANALQGSGLGVGNRSFELRLSDGPSPDKDSGPLVAISTRTPKCELADLDGDGHLDLLIHRNGRLFAGLQRPGGRLEEREQTLPLPEDRLMLADPAFAVQFADINGDRRADLILTTSARRSDDVEARVDLFLTREDGSWPDQPTARLRLQALAGPPQLVDLDGDGDLDLACVSLRTSAMRAFTGDAASALDAQLSFFRNDGAKFARPAMLTRPLPLAGGESRVSPLFVLARAGRAGQAGDVLLHIDGGVERRPLEPDGERMRLGNSSGRVAVAAKTRLVALEPGPRGEPQEFLILGESEVQHVRFPR